MKILGIETSCDETAAAVVEDGVNVLSNVVASQIDAHRVYGGVVPEIASRMHSEAICEVVSEAVEEAQSSFSDIDAVAVTACPGLIGALLVGVNFAKGLSLTLEKPLVPVHHLRGHIAANYLSHPELEPPFLCLVVSGGHSHIVIVRTHTEFEVLGRTRDDAAGEAFDKAARCMGLSYPGGVELDRLAESGDDHAYELPRPRVDGSKYDYSFSGLKTAVINIVHNSEQRGEAVDMPGLAASYRRAVIETLMKNFLQAAKDMGIKKLAAAGGVSANSLLRSELLKLSDAGFEIFLPELKYCGDNAAMIAAQGYHELLACNTAGMELNARPTAEI